MPPRTTGVSVHLTAAAASASAAIEEVLRRTALIYKELEELRRLSEYVAKLPEVMARWYGDSRFSDEQSRPRPLPLRGRRSVTSLVRQVFPTGEVAQIIHSLVHARAVEQRGRLFYALSHNVCFAEDVTLAQIHSLHAVSRLLGTVHYNINQPDARLRLFERCSIVYSIPLSKLPEIHTRIQEESSEMLDRIDDFMQEHQVPVGSELTATVSLGAYEAIEPVSVVTSAARTPKARRPQRISGGKR